MLLPGFSADASLLKLGEIYSGRSIAGLEATGFPFVPQRQSLPAANGDSSLASRRLSGCIDVDHQPVCHSRSPFTPGTCCDSTVEKICHGQRVAICTFTDCSGFPDTASL